MKNGIKYLAVLFSAVFLLTILIPAQSLISQEQADEIQLISITPPKNTILHRGTSVPFEVKVYYKLESQLPGYVYAGLFLPNHQGVPIGQVDVSQGSGTVVISGLIDVETLYGWWGTDMHLDIELAGWFSEEEAMGLDHKCLPEYSYYIEGEAPQENQTPADAGEDQSVIEEAPPENQSPAADEGEDQLVIEEEAPPENQSPAADEGEDQLVIEEEAPPENQSPVCNVKLQKNGAKIGEIDIGEFFNIYVGDSNDDTAIIEVRFSSDDSQDGNPTGEWTNWYNWNASTGDWNASTKIKMWSFATGENKEVWAEVKDDASQTDRASANITATSPENQRPAASFFEKKLKAGFIVAVPGLPPVVTALAQITVRYEQDEQIEDKFWVREINYQYDGDYWGSSRISIVSSGVRLWSVTIGTKYKQDVFYPNMTVYSTDKIELYTAGIPGPSLWDLLGDVDPTPLPLSLFLRFAPSNAFNSVTFDPLDKPEDPEYLEDYYSPYPYLKQADAEAIQIASPGELRVYDSQGNVTGIVEGNIKTEIPNSLYIENSIIIFFAEDFYTYVVYGMDDAEYDINAASIKEGKSALASFADIPIISGAVHQYTVDWDVLSQGRKGVTLQIDADGDGTFEKTFTTDSEFTYNEFVFFLQRETAGLSFWIWIAGGVGIILILLIACILIKRLLARR